LESVEERLYRIETLEKKYRADVAGLVAREREIGDELAALDAHGEDIDALTAEREAARRETADLATELTKKRRAAATKLAREVQKSLAELGLEKAAFETRIEPRGEPDLGSPNASSGSTAHLAEERRFAADGTDLVEFFL